MTAPDRLAQTLIKILAKRGRPHMTKPQDARDLGEKPVHEAKVIWQWLARLGTIWVSNQGPAE
jgi:hypothetical protein